MMIMLIAFQLGVNTSDLTFTPSVRKTSYLISASTAYTLALEANNASNIISDSFYVGIDLENYAVAPKDTIFAGGFACCNY